MKFLKDKHHVRVKGTLAALALLAAFGPGLASDSLYEVAKVSVDTTAKDAVVARALALEAGQKALRVVLKRIVPGSAQAMLPPISDQDVEGNDQQPLGAQRAELDHALSRDVDRLQAELNQNGFALEDRNGTFVLRSR
jgi:hypothetical protein